MIDNNKKVFFQDEQDLKRILNVLGINNNRKRSIAEDAKILSKKTRFMNSREVSNASGTK